MKLQIHMGHSENHNFAQLSLTMVSIFLLFTSLTVKPERQGINSGSSAQVELDINKWLEEEGLLATYQIDNTLILKQSSAAQKPARKKKKRTLIIYFAADNDLGPFAVRNIRQIANIGSTDSINILIHLDIKAVGKKKVTRRFYVEKNKLVQLNADDPATQKMDSGDPQTLISCFGWGVLDFPADEFDLLLWNHGTGPLDPQSNRIFNANELFTYNAITNKLDLDRSIGFLEYISLIEYFNKIEQRGVCWDNTTGNYLTNQKLEFALKTICNKHLGGNKISLLGFDACLMNSIEIASMAKKYAKVMVGSQEVVLGSGWNYQKVLAPFVYGSLAAPQFAQHIVQAYDEAYHAITGDYTQAAINLACVEALEKNISTIALLLTECLKKQHNKTVKKAIQASRNKRACTHFDEPSYIDLHHFLCNIQRNMDQFKFTNAQNEQQLKQRLRETIEEAKKNLRQAVIANKTGTNLKNAAGLSIYFPEQRIHSSYKKTSFASTSYWGLFLTTYLLS